MKTLAIVLMALGLLIPTAILYQACAELGLIAFGLELFMTGVLILSKYE